jgi:hypothetical protein
VIIADHTTHSHRLLKPARTTPFGARQAALRLDGFSTIHFQDRIPAPKLA